MNDLNTRLASFTDTVDREFDRKKLASFWKLEGAVRDFVRAGIPREFLDRELQRLVADPTFAGDWRPNQVILHRGRSFAVAVWMFEKPRRYIHTMPFYGMYVPLGHSPLRYDLYRLPPRYDNQVFDGNLQLERAGSGEVAAGEVLCLTTDELVYDFKVDGPVPVLKLTTAPFHTMEWLFNRETLFAWQANDSTLPSSQLRVAAYVLGKLAHQSSVEPLGELTTHLHHSVRWAAIQSLGRIHRTVAIEKLTAAVHDPHPHVRRAAARALQQFQPR